MNYKNILFLVILAFFLSLLDSSFFSFLPLFGATILSTYIVILTLAVRAQPDELVVLSFGSVLFYSIFSSIALWFLLIFFFLLPQGVCYLRKNYFPETSIILVAPLFIVSTMFFALVMIFLGKEFSANSWAAFIYFIILNSISGISLFYLIRLIQKNFSRGEIKFHGHFR